MQKAGRVAALGFFDGVHTGHGALLRRTKSCAEKLRVTPAVMTYSRHPSAVVGKNPVKLINTTAERCALIRELYGIDDIIVRDFTKEYSSLSCEEFFEKVLIGELCAVGVVAGFDFRFGKNGSGDAKTLVELSKRYGICCEIVDAVTYGGEAVSSTRVRELLEAGDVGRASELLGHYHCIISEVTHGRNLGSEIGFPTVNQTIAQELGIPRFGVYVSRVTIDGKFFCGVTNIGIRPTVSEGEAPRAETFILDFSGDLYGKTIKVELLHFLRDERKFASVAELSERIALDVSDARSFYDSVF